MSEPAEHLGPVPSPHSPELEEAPWEAEVGALLRALPDVEPPDGFLARAVDHRPLHAGRTVLALVAATIVVLGVSAATGLVDRSVAIPEMGLLASRHSAAQASLAGTGGEGAADVDAATDPSSPIPMPDGYQREATIEADDLQQAVWSKEGEAVSVFVQEGQPDWEALPATGRVLIAGEPAWVDEALQITVLEAGDETVTIIGLPPAELAAVIASLPSERPSLRRSVVDLAAKLAEQIGFPGPG